MRILISLFLVSFLFSENSHAWGRRGHSLVAYNAAYILADEVGDAFYKSHSFDLGYYANTPDFFWKEPATYNREHPQHYIDREVFERGLKNYKGSDPYEMTREEFDKKFPDIPQDAGRAYWRIREINDQLSDVTKKLSLTDLTKDDRFATQAQWLVLSGVIAHYVGDLAQPLHVTENHNGQLTNQNGIHSFFEDACVDELFGSLEQKTSAEARKRWKFFHKKNGSKSILALLKELTSESYADLAELLKIDKKVGHTDAKKGSQAYRGMIEERIIVGSLYLAEILSRQTSWKPDNNRFFNFVARPAYIEPGVSSAQPSPTPEVKK